LRENKRGAKQERKVVEKKSRTEQSEKVSPLRPESLVELVELLDRLRVARQGRWCEHKASASSFLVGGLIDLDGTLKVGARLPIPMIRAVVRSR